MNNKKKNDPKNALIALGAILLISLFNVASDGGDLIGILIVITVAAAVIFAVIKKTAETKKTAQSTEEKVYTAAKPSAPASCDYGKINCDYSHDYARRVEQLDSFLKNGTIDRAEYNTLLEKYRKNYEEHRE